MRATIEIGKYTLTEYEDDEVLQNTIWIRHEDGEGGTFSKDGLEKAIEQFFKENF